MANRWCDGFGRYGGDEAKMTNGSSSSAWAQVDYASPPSWLLSNANPRTGNWHLRLSDGIHAPIVRRVFGAPLTEVFFGHALYFEKLPTVEPEPGDERSGFFIAKFRTQANQPMIAVFLGTDGAIVVYRGGDNGGTGYFVGTFLGRSLPVVGAGAYQHFEHYLKVGNGDGAYELRINEVTVLNLTGIDTDNGGGEVSQVSIGSNFDAAFAGGIVDLADCYVNDTVADGSACDTFVGDCKSGVLMVNGDTAQADFVLSSGVSGYQLLNEVPPNDGGYITTAATAAESDFAFEDGPGNLSEILTARPFNRAWKDDAGTCTIGPSMKSGGSKSVVNDQPVSEAPAYYDSNVPIDPDTGVPWTPGSLNAALEVAERVS